MSFDKNGRCTYDITSNEVDTLIQLRQQEWLENFKRDTNLEEYYRELEMASLWMKWGCDSMDQIKQSI
jgi:hypothetical protein